MLEFAAYAGDGFEEVVELFEEIVFFVHGVWEIVRM